mgnify:CR=1 FL=1
MTDTMGAATAALIVDEVIEATDEDMTKAWQSLIDTGIAWKLQGWYGRTARAMITAGFCSPAPST